MTLLLEKIYNKYLLNQAFRSLICRYELQLWLQQKCGGSVLI
jgi:hypothetical protein